MQMSLNTLKYFVHGLEFVVYLQTIKSLITNTNTIVFPLFCLHEMAFKYQKKNYGYIYCCEFSSAKVTFSTIDKSGMQKQAFFTEYPNIA